VVSALLVESAADPEDLGIPLLGLRESSGEHQRGKNRAKWPLHTHFRPARIYETLAIRCHGQIFSQVCGSRMLTPGRLIGNPFSLNGRFRLRAARALQSCSGRGLWDELSFPLWRYFRAIANPSNRESQLFARP
jgi:hypothetical protein